MRFSLLFLIFLVVMTSCNEQAVKNKVPVEDSFSEVPEWAQGVVWYQIFPERFRNGDPGNDPLLSDQEGCWPHELIEPWEVHPWGSDWYELQDYEKEVGKDPGYNLTRRRYGGDLQGIIDKLDYLRELGIGAIYLNPVFVSPSHHKYDIVSYHHIDPNFGPDPEGDRKIMEEEIPDDPSTWKWTSADKLALDLIKEAHDRGIRIIFDGVFNHVGYNHFAISDVREKQQESRFADWFTVISWEDQVQGTGFRVQGWWGIKDMPELREDENGIVEGPRKYIFDITRRWMDPYGNGDLTKGIDGWRLDVAFEVGHPFWKDWRRHVRGINAEAYLVAEVIETPENLKPYLEGDEFDAVMNYNFDFICSEFFINKDLTAAQFDSLLLELRDPFRPEVNLSMQNLLGSHDTDRPSSRIKNKGIASFLKWQDYFGIGKSGTPEYKTSKPSEEDYEVLKLMAAFQMTYPGSPMIYYGDEVGMWGAGDPDCRKPMIWEDIEFAAEAVGPGGDDIDPSNSVSVNSELLDYYKQLIRIRTSHPALHKGGYQTLLASEGAYAFMRVKGKDLVVSVFNNKNKPQRIEIKNIPAGGYINELNEDQYIIEESGLILDLEGNSAAILHKNN